MNKIWLIYESPGLNTDWLSNIKVLPIKNSKIQLNNSFRSKSISETGQWFLTHCLSFFINRIQVTFCFFILKEIILLESLTEN